MKTTIHFTENEKEEANVCVNVTRIIRILDNVWDYAEVKHNTELLKIIQDYLNLKEL